MSKLYLLSLWQMCLSGILQGTEISTLTGKLLKHNAIHWQKAKSYVDVLTR